jgi:hypothetical protein
MIRFSDSAAADYLLELIGDEQVTSFVDRMGMSAQDPLRSALGEFRAWHRAPEQWLTMSPADRVRAAREMAASEESSLDTVPVPDAIQQRCAAVGCRGTPREWARLMADVAAGAGLPAAAHRSMREALERPLAPGDDRVFGAKAGDLPGILTFAGYVRDRSSGACEVAMAMFLTGLDRARVDRLSGALPQTPGQLLELSRTLAALR